jgi:hypothetical protein
MPFFVNLLQKTVCRTILFLFIFPVFCWAQEGTIRGEIVDSVTISKTKGETFALYLPKSFDPQAESPILFVFDPAARGKVGLAPFIASSEKHGVILVCSNNSKNGSYDRNFDLANNLFNHIFKTYKVDSNRMFLSGFSGGSRLAAAIATLTNQFAGVIACGAGFSSSPLQTLSTQKFLYAGICGVEDMNYLEMFTNDQYLSKLKFEHTIISFNGGHQWPPVEQINHAFDWMFLKNKPEERLSLDSTLTQQLVDNHNQIIKYKERGELLLASEYYKRLLGAYPKAALHDSIQNAHQSLLASKAYKVALKQRNEAFMDEKKISVKLIGRLKSDFKRPEKINWKWWSKELSKFFEIGAKGSKQERYMVSRIKNALVAFIYESKIANPIHTNNATNKELFLRFRGLIYPENE